MRPIFAFLFAFVTGAALQGVSSADAQDGFQWVVQPGFDDAGAAHDGAVPVKQGALWGLMGRDGQWIASPQFEEMGGQGIGRFAAKRAGKWGMVDSDGNEVLAFVHDAIGTPDVYTPVRKDGEWRLIRHDGYVDPVTLDIDTLTGNAGKCVVGVGEGTPKILWWAEKRVTTKVTGMKKILAPTSDRVLIDTGNGWVLLNCGGLSLTESTPRYEDARRAFGGFFAVKRNGLWGFEAANSSFGPTIAPQFTAVRDFSEGLAPVQVASGKWGYIDTTGAMVISPNFDAAFGHSDGIAGIRIGEARGFIDRYGRTVIKPQFADFWRHSEGLTPVKQGEKWGVIAVEASNPARTLALPLEGLTKRLASRVAPISLTPSTPHFYFGQDIQTRHDIQFSPDGKVMLTVLASNGIDENEEIALWDRASRKLIRKIKLPGLLQAVLLPDSQILAAGTVQGDVVLLDAVTGSELHRARVFDGSVSVLALSPDGTHLAALGVGAGQVQLWSLPDGRPLARFRAASEKLTFAADGQSIWLGDSFGGVRRVSLAGAEISAVRGGLVSTQSWFSSEPMTSLRPDMALSDSGALLRLERNSEKQADGSFAQKLVLRLTTPKGKQTIDLPAGVRDVLSVDISPDGKHAAYAGEREDGSGAFWSILDIATGKEVAGLQSAADGYLAWTDRLRFTPDGGLLMIGGEGGDIQEVDAVTSQIRATYGAPLTLAVGVVALPDSTNVYTVNGGGQILRWDLVQGVLAGRVETGISAGVETYFGTDGRVLAVESPYDDTERMALAFGTLELLGDGPAQGMQQRSLVDNYGKRAPVDRVIQAQLGGLPGQDDYLTAIPLANGRFGLVSNTVGEHRLYELPSGRLLATFLASPSGEWLVLTPEGFFAASANGAQLVSVSNGLRSFAVDQVYQALYRPDLVAAKLAGDPEGKVAAAAAQLDLSVILGSGPAPSTRFSFPPDGTTATDEMVEVGVELLDEGGGVGRIEWRVNGLTVEVQEAGARGVAALEAEDADLTKAQIALEPGENLIEVVAYNAAGLLASSPRSLTLRWDGVASSVPPTLHVLSVGVNDYADGRLALKYAAADARAFADAIGKAGAGVFGEVNVVTLLDRDVTQAGLDAAFAQMATQVKSQDVFIFFLAGHGKTVEGEYHFIPADFTFAGDDPIREKGVRQDQWQAWMAAIRARKSIMIYDTCESGSLTGTRSVDAALAQSAAVTRLTRAMGRTILSASTDDAPALEGYQGHGVMTYALLQALGEGDANGNAMIEVTELAGFLDRVVPEISQAAFNFRQVPQMSIRGSDFALGAQVAVLGNAPERFPATLTHVVAGGTGVLDAPGGAVVQTIEGGVFFGVFLIEERAGYARVAKDGAALGWVPLASLGRLQ